MAYRMEEVTPYVRVGRTGSGDLDIEVWQVRFGWEVGADLGPMESLLIPQDAVEDLFDFLR